MLSPSVTRFTMKNTSSNSSNENNYLNVANSTAVPPVNSGGSVDSTPSSFNTPSKFNLEQFLYHPKKAATPNAANINKQLFNNDGIQSKLRTSNSKQDSFNEDDDIYDAKYFHDKEGEDQMPDEGVIFSDNEEENVIINSDWNKKNK